MQRFSMLRRLAARRAIPLISRNFAQKSNPPPVPAKKGLSSVLALELEYEREEGAGSSEATMGEVRAELADWRFDVAPQRARFSLSRRVGAQEVRLDLDCTPVPAEDDEAGAEGDEDGGRAEGAEGADEEEAPADGYRMLVTIKEPGKASALQVGCFLGSALRIHRVALFPAGKEPSADVVFGGVRSSNIVGKVAQQKLHSSQSPHLLAPNFHPLAAVGRVTRLRGPQL
jgi:hypothetical protein